MPILFALRSSQPQPERRPRRGRLLLECLISMLLLSAATLAITTSTRASAMLADDATLVARAQAIGSESLELARILSACAAPVPAVRAVPRVTATLLPTVGAGVVVSLFSATLTLSPFAGRTDPLLSLGTARRCE